MKRILATLTAAATAVLVLAGCAPIDYGTITSKEFEKHYTYSTEECVDSPNQGAGCAQKETVEHTVADRWKFTLRQGELNGYSYVDEDTYEQYKIGDYFNADKID